MSRSDLPKPYSARRIQRRPDAEETVLLTAEAWRLRAVEGLASLEIAGRMNLSVATIRRYLAAAREMLPEEYKTRAATYFEEAIAQLDSVIEACFGRIRESRDAGRLDLAAVDRYIKANSEKRKLLGLDRDRQRVEVSGVDGGAIKLQAVADQIAELARRRRAIRELGDAPEASS